MKFITLTYRCGKEVHVNIDHIIAFEKDTTYPHLTCVIISGTLLNILVKEGVLDIRAKLRQCI